MDFGDDRSRLKNILYMFQTLELQLSLMTAQTFGELENIIIVLTFC